jgi:hypothetical protein
MKKVLLLLTFFYSVSALGAPLPTADEIWKLYDAKEYNKVLSKIYLLKNIPSKQNDPDLYFLEALLAYQTGSFP